MERADITMLVIDAEEGITEQDARIAGIAHDQGKAVLIAVNKWDAVEKDNHTMNEFIKKIRSVLSFLSYAEIIFISAKTRATALPALAALVCSAAPEVARSK